MLFLFQLITSLVRNPERLPSPDILISYRLRIMRSASLSAPVVTFIVVIEVNVKTATSSDNVSTVKSSPVASILYSPL